MSPELYRRARRAEAKAERRPDRRRLRVDFFRGALAVRAARDAGAPVHAVGPGAADRPQSPLPGRLRGHGAYRSAEPDLDAGGPVRRRRPPALHAVPPGAARERLPAGLRAVPDGDAGRARPAVPEVRRLALHG